MLLASIFSMCHDAMCVNRGSDISCVCRFGEVVVCHG